jgi:TRAP-type C4-dicarboxylate transport system permease small subunit
MISTITAFQTGRVSAVMNYPLWIGMSFIPIGSILLLFYILIDFVNVFKEKSNNNKV